MNAVFGDLVSNTPALYIAIATILLTAVYYCYNNRSLPPGPTGLPFIGFYPFWKNDSSHLQLQELGKKYGDVFSFTILRQLYVNLGNHKVLREAMVTKANCFDSRPQHFMVSGLLFQGGLIFFNGDRWKIFRKFLIQQFRESGVNNLKNDGDTVIEMIKGTVRDLYESKGEPVELVNMLTDKATRILYSIIFGESGITMKEIRELNNSYSSVFSNIGGATFLLTGNIAKYLILPLMPSYWRIRKDIDFQKKKLYEIIDRHKATFDENHSRNLIDSYLKEKKNREFKKDPTAEYFTDRALMATLIQIVGDGVITVAAAIASSIQALLDHPEEQDKIYKELIEVIGVDRDPSLEDKSKLPYTNAFILEVTRTTDVFPFFADMECTKETTVGGYRIPKGAVTVMNIWSCHYDPKEYEDPEKFNPSRFLPSEGKKKVEQTVLFGLGKRACIGEGYTMSQVFLFLTTIVKHFRLSKPKDMKSEGVLFMVGTVHICAQPRTNKKRN